MMDDILIISYTHHQHDERLRTVLQRLASAGLTLNKDNCQFSQPKLRFFSYIITSDGIRPDLEKFEAIVRMPTCKDMSDVRRFLGMASQLGRVSPNFASLSQPLSDLLIKQNARSWNEHHQSAFERIKDGIEQST